MNTQHHFEYQHIDSARKPLEKRRKFSLEIPLEHFYFVGFKVEVDFDTIYQHDLIIADDFEMFLYALEEKIRMIQDQKFEFTPHEVQLVFMRNLKMTDPSIRNTVRNSGIQHEWDLSQKSTNRDHYAVLGMINDGIDFHRTRASHGLAAIHVAKMKLFQFHGKSFSPLELCQAHPVTQEFNFIFEEVAKRVITLLNFTSTQAEQLHPH